MTQNDSVNTATSVLLGIIFVSVFLAVMLLATYIIIDAVSLADTNTNGITLTTVTVINETGYANSSGYTISGISAYGFTNPTLTGLFNRTSGTIVSLGNATLSSTGILRNATAKVYPNLSISYTYQYDTTNVTALNTALTGMKTNTLSLVTNFFALMPTVGTILAVVLLIAGVVILVLYVRKMKDQGTEGYTG